MSMRRVYDPVHDSMHQSQEEDQTPFSEDDVTSPLPNRERTYSRSSANGKSAYKSRRLSIMSLMNDDDAKASSLTENPNAISQPEESQVVNASSSPAEQINTGASDPSKKREPSRYQRHLKKTDGNSFTRSDIQYGFMTELFQNDYCIFTNMFKPKGFTFDCNMAITPLSKEANLGEQEPSGSSSFEVSEEGSILNHFINHDKKETVYDARGWINNDYLTFGQLYVLSLVCSARCSKVLRDKILTDSHIAFAMCILSLLVNIGRLNTTNNFFIEMTSQSRTFHTIPVLQYGINPGSVHLQDTPRIKSILKHLRINKETTTLEDFYQNYTSDASFNVIYLLFAMFETPNIINEKFLAQYVEFETFEDNENEKEKKNVTLFDISDNGDYDSKQRADIFIWLIYIHLEKQLTETQLEESVQKFQTLSEVTGKPSKKFKLSKSVNAIDKDTSQETEYSREQNEQRKEFLAKNNLSRDEEHTLSTNNSPSKQDTLDQDFPKEEEEEDYMSKEESSITDNTSTNDSKKEFSKKNSPKRNSLEPLSPNFSKSDDTAESSQKKRKLNKKVASSLRTEKNGQQIAQSKEAMEDSKVLSKEPVSSKNSKNEKLLAQLIDTEEKRLLRLDPTTHSSLSSTVRNNKDFTQQEFKRQLYHSQVLAGKKRNELGYLKVFQDYEDIPMATVLGIRGKKKKKYQDSVLGFETDMLKAFKVAKSKMLESVAEKLFED
ncbi:hypothetical protein ACO0RG_003763 [Hanseniaspora osmophila]